MNSSKVTKTNRKSSQRGAHSRTKAIMSPEERDAMYRKVTSLTLLLGDIAVLVATVADLHGSVRFILGLVLGMAIPGWSIVGLLKLGNPALEVGLTIAVSLALLIVVSQILMTVHEWHLTAAEVTISLICLPSLAWQVSGRPPIRIRLK